MFHNQFTGRFGRSHFQRGKGSLGFLSGLFCQIGAGRSTWGAHYSKGRERCSPNQGIQKAEHSLGFRVFQRKDGILLERRGSNLGPAALPTILLQNLFHSPPFCPHSWRLPRRKGKGSQGGLQFPLVLVWSCRPLHHHGTVSLVLEHPHSTLQSN